MEAKKRKLEEQFELEANSDSRGGIFQGVAIFVNGYTSKYELCTPVSMNSR